MITTNKFIDTAIEKGIILLLIFTPLAFGTVQPWSVAVMEITAFSIFFLLILKKCLQTFEQPATGHYEKQNDALSVRDAITRFVTPRPEGPRQSQTLTCLFILFAALILLILFQMLPLPDFLLQIISPAALETYRKFGDYAAGAFHPVSINPYATRQELFKLLSYAAVFFVIADHYRTRAQVNALVKTILYMGCFLVVFAVIQKMTWNGRVFWIYPVDEALSTGMRIWGPYINYNHFAGYMGMAIPLGMGLLLYTAPRVTALPGVPLRKRIARFLASDKLAPFTLLFLIVLIMAASLLMSLSRGGILGFVFSSLFFAWITHSRRSLRRKTALIAVLAAVIFAAVVLAAWERLEQRFADLEQDHLSRLHVWEDSLGIVRDYPVLGTGLGTFESAYMRYQTKMPRLLFDHAHNDYLEIVTDTGVIGFLFAMGMALFFFLSLFKRWKKKHSMFGKCIGAGGLSACIAISVHSFTDFNLHIPANALLLTVIAGITYAAVYNVSESREHGA
ncbi:MAG: O-antigen ligase family protein [Deltaproteobacteria bacterium]|nr:O-antigen ligase family protein [Deltaproteobacteria bacterium]